MKYKILLIISCIMLCLGCSLLSKDQAVERATKYLNIRNFEVISLSCEPETFLKSAKCNALVNQNIYLILYCSDINDACNAHLDDG